MPRSARLSTAPKRNARRNASKQCSVYDIPESPSDEKNDKQDKNHEAYDNSHSIKSATSPPSSIRARSTSSSLTAVSAETDLTCTRNRPLDPKNSPTAAQRPIIPGFEALEAVNSLYQQLKDSRSEIDHVNRQHDNLSLELQKQKKQVESLQAELKLEKERSSNIQKGYEREVHKLHQVSRDDLTTILSSLRHFSSAAHNLMPLLDVLAGATEISYDEDTEKLYQILNRHKPEVLSQ